MHKYPYHLVQMDPETVESLIYSVLDRWHRDRAARAANDAQAVSLAQAAKIARKRKAIVQAAAESGALLAARDGRRWRLTAADVAVWVRAGCPAVPTADLALGGRS